MSDSTTVIHHPEEFPIELDSYPPEASQSTASSLQLMCSSNTPYHFGDKVRIKIPDIAEHLEVYGVVNSCISAAQGYDISISFCDDDARMRIRMLEQLCYIQRYRRHILQSEGRSLNDQDAALEWIGRYADLFPLP